jgi:hypothetical protein
MISPVLHGFTFLKGKNKVFSCFKDFLFFAENQYSAKIKVFRSDNGTEYVNKIFSELLKSKGILYQTTCINTPEQNGVSERKNRHLLNVIRSLPFQNNVPKTYWSDAVLTATYLINRLPSARLRNMSPLKIFKGRKIDLDHIRVFGCTCFVHIKRNDKLDKKSVKTIFLGYSSEKKGYKSYDPTNFTVYFSRDMAFFENTPYYQTYFPNQPTVIQPHNFIFPEETSQEQVEKDHTHASSAIPSGGDGEESQEEVQEEIAPDTDEGAIHEELVLRRSVRQT